MAVFQVPESKAAKADGQFQFKLPGSKKTFSVPLLQYLPVDRAGAAAKFDAGQVSPDEMAEVFKAMFGDDELAALALKLDGEQLGALVSAWGKASDVSLGESQASED